jgi:hypothetical protein
LQNPWMARLCNIRRFTTARNPFVFKGQLFGFANSPKFIFGRNGGNQCVADKKNWIHRFLDFATPLMAVAPWIVDYPKSQHSTIPHFQKQIVAGRNGATSADNGGFQEKDGPPLARINGRPSRRAAVRHSRDWRRLRFPENTGARDPSSRRLLCLPGVATPTLDCAGMIR